ncbi:MAG: 4-diphosphocytidyl-2-C-methyl-D-erythritol kinase [Candidatus Atelocyanobacterium thalassa isolate SIO64986]|uniref:4-diphosphocytidyl-2-C-methyl-D-erythritol kinase n=1 Tax=Candidatus Atelocyanobacterium thalassa isolate SIO64986 TaxID=1527444 RepID=A0A086CI86_9CHRO|nr:MAG: 4-diphosphocytidyl-2-C-methyl-D-erythritol kinase [Candidatus Atelocyanobacterium thalassa isolate SIO64986]
MKICNLVAPAKINLYLEVLGERVDHYHELIMVLQSIELSDYIKIYFNGTRDFNLYCNNSLVPLNETNIAYRAAQLIVKKFPKFFDSYGGVDIIINKCIPVAAGLAGGSADGAAVLLALNLLWKLKLNKPELEKLSENLGSDVPFCITGGTAIATGRGETLNPIENLDNLWVVLAKYQNFSISTPWAYQNYKERFGEYYWKIDNNNRNNNFKSLVNAISHKNDKRIGELLHNDLEKVVLPKHLVIDKLKSFISKTGGLGTMMSGSGPTIFTLCESYEKAQDIKNVITQELQDSNLELFISKLSNNGIKIMEN